MTWHLWIILILFFSIFMATLNHGNEKAGEWRAKYMSLLKDHERTLRSKLEMQNDYHALLESCTKKDGVFYKLPEKDN